MLHFLLGLVIAFVGVPLFAVLAYYYLAWPIIRRTRRGREWLEQREH